VPRIVLDCDPGVDDAWAILHALGDPGLELAGITTVAGNAGLGATTANALRLCEFAGADVPVVAGNAVPLGGGPLTGDVAGAGGVHGAGGLGEARLPAPVTRPRDGHAADFLVETVGAAPGEVTIVATGPLTNVALALRRRPGLAEEARDVVVMGGSLGAGNATPYAEFNIAADPEAAALVFAAGRPVTMVGLDVTLRFRTGAGVLERVRRLGPLARDLLLPALAGYRDDQAPDGSGAAAGRPMHDVCATALVADPGLFRCRPARVHVETADPVTAGRTVADFEAADPNARVAEALDAGAAWDRVLAAYARLASRMAARGDAAGQAGRS
jgi:purine nucleosidase